MPRCCTILLLTLLVPMAARAQLQIETAFPGLTFTRPVELRHANDGSARLFVVEQGGVIRVFDASPGATESRVFLDIRDRVDTGGNEEGLLGLAFHPSYAENGYLYVNYTAASPNRTVISRFSVSASNPDAADPASETVLLEFAQPFSNHNGGKVTFGPDGYLYIGTGDGGSGGDPQNNAQNRQSLLGKILRVDVDHPSGGLPYGIPADNPFVGNDAGFREEIWAYGLRNPWRFSFDAETGDLWVGDVGQNRFEEIDIVEGGKNYGWRVMEAFECFNPSSGCDQAGLTLPVWSYGRTEGQSVTGGIVYRGSRLPELQGMYIYADFVSGAIWGLREGQNGYENTLLLQSGKNIASFAEDERNEAYICAFDGAIYRLSSPATSAESANPVPGFALGELYPNPVSVSSSAAVRITLSGRSLVTAVIYDILGRPQRVLAAVEYTAGVHVLRIDTAHLAPGVYVLGVTTAAGSASRRLLVH